VELAERLNAVIDAAIGNRLVGCVVLVSRDGESLYARAAGYADREANKVTSLDTIFRLASVTKPIVASAALRMVDAGLLGLDDPVSKYLPFFTPKGPDGSTPPILIRQLLTHSSGLAYSNVPPGVTTGTDPVDDFPLEENLRRMARGTLTFMPGTACQYGMSIDVLGGVIAAINGNVSDVQSAVERYVTGPLGMTDTIFGVVDPSRLAVPYADGKPEPVRMADPQLVPTPDGAGAMNMSPGRIFKANTAQCGGSGMAGTAGDFMKLVTAWQSDFLKPATRDAALALQTGALRMDPGMGYAFLGAFCDDPAPSGWGKGSVHWGGIWGNSWIIQPETRTSVVALTNTMWEGCNGPFTFETRDAVFP